MERKEHRTPEPRKGAGLTERSARAAALHPWRTIVAYVALVVIAVVAAGALLSSGLTSEMQQRGEKPDSDIGQRLIDDRLTGEQPTTDFVIVQHPELTVDDPAYKTFVNGLADEIQGLGPDVVAGVSTFYQSGDQMMVSKDRRSMLLPVAMAGDMDDALENVEPLHKVVEASEAQGFTLAQSGEASLNAMANELAESDMRTAEIFGVPVALVVLVFVFGAVLAAFTPLLLSAGSIILALALTALIGQFYPMSVFVLNVLTMMGLAVGIDYTLFIISRYREERARGRDKVDAIAATGATANRAIFFSGMTVVLAMIGMVICPVDITISMGVGVMLVVVTTLLTSLVLLPALLGLVGDRINALRVPLIGRLATRRANGHGGVWERLSHSIMRRPVIWLAAAVAVLLLAAAPVLLMQPGSNGMTAAGYPDDEYAKQGWDIIDRDFSLGTANPVQIVVDLPADGAAATAGVARLTADLEADERFGPVQAVVGEAGDLTLLSTPLAGDPASETTQAVIRELRENVVPEAFGDAADHVYVTGTTAGVVDYLGFFDHWLPIALAVVLGLSFVLLLLAFRSIVIPAKAIAMNLLSVGAAYGLLVLVFQEGIGARLLGLQQVESIEAWVPLMLFCMLFGLSMDYQVFLLSRIKERFDHSGDTREAVAYGVGRTAGIITGAAAIMVCVFGAMAAGDLVMFQQMGFGLAVAILLDATVVRIIIVPAAMELLGDWNWYLPRWLRWLPNVSVEGREVAAPDADAERPAWHPPLTGTPALEHAPRD